MATKLLLTPKEVGERVGYSAAAIRDAIREGQIKAVTQRLRRRAKGRPDRPRVFITAAEADRYIAALPAWKPQGAKREKQKRTAADVRSEIESVPQYE